MRTARLFDGTILRFPDGTANEVIERVAREETAKRRGDDGIGAALKRGWFSGWAEPAETGAGAIGLIEDIIPGKRERVESAEQSLRESAARTRAKGGAGEADVFIEKLAEGLAAAPGTIASMAPFLLGAAAAVPAAPIGAPAGIAALTAAGAGALGFGAHGLARSGGEGLGRAAMGGLRGAAEGAAFGGVGHAVRPITSALGRRLAHGAGAGAIGGGASALAGEGDQDILAHAATLGILGLVSPGKKAEAKVDPREFLKRAKWREAAPTAKMGAASARDPLLGKRGVGAKRFTEYEELKPPGFPINLERAHEALSVKEKIYRDVTEHPEMFKREPITIEGVEAESARLIERGFTVERQKELAKSFDLPFDQVKVIVSAGERLAAQGYERAVAARSEMYKMMDEGRPEHVIDAQRRLSAELGADALEAVATSYGFKSETARALRQLQYTNEASSPLMKKILKIEDQKILDRVIDAEARGDFKAARELLDTASKPKLRDKLYEVWINGLLSAPVTHMVNFSSNAMVQGFTAAERALAVGIDIGRAGAGKLRGKDIAREHYATEIFADLHAFGPGFKKGFAEAIKALKSEEYGMFEGKMEYHRMAIGGRGGEFARLPGRALKAGDMFWRAIATERELAVQAVRQARKEGRRGAEAGARAAEIRSDITKYPAILKQAQKTGNQVLVDKANLLGDIRAAADRAGHYQVFTQRLGPKGQWAIQGREKLGYPAKVVVPFIRTPVNILKFGLERTPYGLTKFGRASGGTIAEQVARASLGTALMAGIAAAASEGLITGGGPADWTAQSNLRNTGWQPYSIRFPAEWTGLDKDQYISYQRIEPLSTIFGFAADSAELGQEPDEQLIDRAISMVKDNLTNKTFLVGVEGLAKAWANPTRESSQWLKQMLGSLVPAGVAKAQQVVDPQLRQIDFRPLERPETAINPLLARIPGISQQLPAKMGTMGQPIQRTATGVERFISAWPRSAAKPERVVEQEFHRLRAHKSIPPMMPKKRKQLTIGGVYEKVELRDEEYDIFHTYHRRANEVLSRIVSSPGYKSMNEEAQAKLLRKVYDKFRDKATKRVNAMIKARKLREKAGNR